MKDFILIFDIPRNKPSIKLKVNRNLHRMNAEKVQQSAWKSDKLDKLIEIATLVKKSRGKARILEEKLIFE